MEKSKNIGVFQLFSLLLLMRILTVVTFSASFSDGENTGDFFPDILFDFIFTLVLIIPVGFFVKNNPDFNPVEKAALYSKNLSRIFSVFYLVAFIFFASRSLSRFYIFTTDIIFPEKNMTVLLFLSVFLCAYAAYLGIEALSRASGVLLIFIVFGVALILFSLRDKIDVLNMERAFSSPAVASLKNGLFASLRTAETAVFLFLFPKAQGNLKKGAIISITAFFLFLIILFFFLYSVSGSFALTQMFPFYSLAVIGGFPFFERSDAVITAVFIFSVLIKTSAIMMVCVPIFEKLTGIKNKVVSLLSISGVMSITSFLFSVNTVIQSFVSSSVLSAVFALGTIIIIPGLTHIISNKSKEKKT